MPQAILLDRDGVINRERADYVKSWEEFEILPGVVAALNRLSSLNVPVLVLTNQSAIGRGLVSLAMVGAIHLRLQSLVYSAGGRIDSFYICPHHPDDGCACRKPKPGLLLQAATGFNLDLTACVFVGDSYTDYQAAQTVGCAAILVQSGRQGSQLPSLLTNHPIVPIVPDIVAAVSIILADPIQPHRRPEDASIPPTSLRADPKLLR
jgi:D-glycero-D-manno-heptose 1,7-bisphosphate phosphatase